MQKFGVCKTSSDWLSFGTIKGSHVLRCKFWLRTMKGKAGGKKCYVSARLHFTLVLSGGKCTNQSVRSCDLYKAGSGTLPYISSTSALYPAEQIKVQPTCSICPRAATSSIPYNDVYELTDGTIPRRLPFTHTWCWLHLLPTSKTMWL